MPSLKSKKFAKVLSFVALCCALAIASPVAADSIFAEADQGAATFAHCHGRGDYNYYGCGGYCG